MSTSWKSKSEKKKKKKKYVPYCIVRPHEALTVPYTQHTPLGRISEQIMVTTGKEGANNQTIKQSNRRRAMRLPKDLEIFANLLLSIPLTLKKTNGQNRVYPIPFRPKLSTSLLQRSQRPQDDLSLANAGRHPTMATFPRGTPDCGYST